MKKHLSHILILILLALALAGAVSILYIYRTYQDTENMAQKETENSRYQNLISDFENKCYGNKYIESQDVGGLTATELEQALRDAGARYMARTATLTIDGEANTLSMKELGGYTVYHCSDGADYSSGKESELAGKLVQMDKELPAEKQAEIIDGTKSPSKLTVTIGFQYRKEGVNSAMDTLKSKYVIPPADARIDAKGAIHKAKDGKNLDLNTIQNHLEAYLGKTTTDNYSASYETTAEKPVWNLDDVKKVNTVISHHSTTFNPDGNRGYNVKLAAKRLHGTFLLPGESISFLDTFYNDSDGKQYKKAGALYKGKSVLAPGGGNCQVSSTAYIACLKAGILPEKRFPHTKPVDYVPMGLDAALSVGAKDLVIKNTLKNPVWILAGTKGNKLLVQFISCKGTLGGRSYQPKSKKISAHKAKSWLDVYQKNKREKRIPLYTDTYY